MFMEKEPPMWLAAIQGFSLLILGTVGVLVVSGLVCALFDLVLRAI